MKYSMWENLDLLGRLWFKLFNKLPAASPLPPSPHVKTINSTPPWWQTPSELLAMRTWQEAILFLADGRPPCPNLTALISETNAARRPEDTAVPALIARVVWDARRFGSFVTRSQEQWSVFACWREHKYLDGIIGGTPVEATEQKNLWGDEETLKKKPLWLRHQSCMTHPIQRKKKIQSFV